MLFPKYLVRFKFMPGMYGIFINEHERIDPTCFNDTINPLLNDNLITTQA